MSTVAGQITQFPQRTAYKERVMFTAKLVLGAAGAVDATNTVADDPAITFTKTANAGEYTVVFPACPGRLNIQTGVYSPIPTVGGAVVTALSASAGTMTLVLVVGVTPTNGASGDAVFVKWVADMRSGN